MKKIVGFSLIIIAGIFFLNLNKTAPSKHSRFSPGPVLSPTQFLNTPTNTPALPALQVSLTQKEGFALYTNSTIGFQFRVPSAFRVISSDSSPNGYGFSADSKSDRLNLSADPSFNADGLNQSQGPDLTFTSFPQEQLTSNNYRLVEKISIHGTQGNLYTWDIGDGFEGQASHGYEFLLTRNGRTYQFDIVGPNKKDLALYLSYIKQIVTSLTFSK